MVRVAPILFCSMFVLMVIHYCAAVPAGKEKKSWMPSLSFKGSSKSNGKETGGDPKAAPASGKQMVQSNPAAPVTGTAGQPADQLSGDVGGYQSNGYYVPVPGSAGQQAYVDVDALELQSRMSSLYGGTPHVY